MVWAQVGSLQARVYCLHENPFMLAKRSQRQLPGCWRHQRNYSGRKPKAQGIPWGPSGGASPGLDGQCSPVPASWKGRKHFWSATRSALLAKSRLPHPIICNLLIVRLLAWGSQNRAKLMGSRGRGANHSSPPQRYNVQTDLRAIGRCSVSLPGHGQATVRQPLTSGLPQRIAQLLCSSLILAIMIPSLLWGCS